MLLKSKIKLNLKKRIFCLRGHRNELFDRIDQITGKHETEIKAKDEAIKELEGNLAVLRKNVNDHAYEIKNKSQEIKNLKHRLSSENLKNSSKSL